MTTIPLFISTDLAFWVPPQHEPDTADRNVNGKTYRLLDPAYLAWLRGRMLALKRASEEGRVPTEAFRQTCKRFNTLQEWAITCYGEDALREAMQKTDLTSYQPPKSQQPPEPQHVLDEPRPADNARLRRATDLVDTIRDEALALGWKLERLYKSAGFEKRPSSRDYGLVCYIGEHDRLGAVTRQSIEIIGAPPTEVTRCFYNPDVEQPWVKRIGKGK